MTEELEPKSLTEVRKRKERASETILKHGMKAAHDRALAEFTDVVERIKKRRGTKSRTV